MKPKQCVVRVIKQYANSHTLDISDSLIAASSMVARIKLYTLNVKDFRFIDGLKII